MKLQGWLDTLPRTRVLKQGPDLPAFKVCGVTGYYAALLVTLLAGVLSGRSLLVLTTLSLAMGLSFYGYGYLRRWLTGRERLVQFEHLWVAEGVVAGLLVLLREPLLPYLDLVSVGLVVCLAFGRIGCTLVGCCHGTPASFGMRYPPEHAEEGFEECWAGVRLFPVQPLEALGLFAIAVVGFLTLRSPVAGTTFIWFLLSHAILRFGLEAVRGDLRPHFLGLSQARWMALADTALGLWLAERGHWREPRALALAAALGAGAWALILTQWWRSPQRRLLSRQHLAELRRALETARSGASNGIASGRTSCGVSYAVTPADFPGAVHLSLGLPEGRRNLPLLSALFAAALGDARVESLSRSSALLHGVAPREALGAEGEGHVAGRRIWASVARREQLLLQAVRQANEAAPSELAVPLTRNAYFSAPRPHS